MSFLASLHPEHPTLPRRSSRRGMLLSRVWSLDRSGQDDKSAPGRPGAPSTRVCRTFLTENELAHADKPLLPASDQSKSGNALCDSSLLSAVRNQSMRKSNRISHEHPIGQSDVSSKNR